MTDFQNSFQLLRTYCEKEKFKGWDPYDGLNSKMFQSIPFLSKNQFFKRSPINFRNNTLVKKGHNPKGLGLFLREYCNLYLKDPKAEYLVRIKELSNQVIKLQTKGYSGACWGYNFDWQARAFFQPQGTPKVVVTAFIAEALIASYKITKEQKYLDAAISSSLFVLNDLNRTYDANGNFSFFLVIPI